MSNVNRNFNGGQNFYSKIRLNRLKDVLILKILWCEFETSSEAGFRKQSNFSFILDQHQLCYLMDVCSSLFISPASIIK